MTTSISSRESSIIATATLEPSAISPAVQSTYRIKHTLASRFLFLILCSAIVLSTLAFGTVHYWALAVFSVGATMVLILWAVDSWTLQTVRVSRNVLQLPLLAMLALGLIQLLPLGNAGNAGVLSVSLTRRLSLDPYSTRLVLVQVAALLIYFAATLVFTDTPQRLRLLVNTIIVFGFFLSIFGLTQNLTSPTKVYWIRELTQSTAFGPFINRHHFAGYMELTTALPLGLLFAGSVERHKKFIYIFAVGLMSVALIMTNSRGGIISLVAEIVFIVTITGFHGFRKARKTEAKEIRAWAAAKRALLALALIVSVFGAVVLIGGEPVLTRFVGSVNYEDPTTGRAHFWRVTLDIIKAHPLVGAGLGAFSLAYTKYDSSNGLYRLEQAHNDYLQVLSDGGIVGSAIGLFFIAMLFRRGFTRLESRDDFRRGVAIGALAGCFAVLVHSFFDFTLHTTSNALLFLVLAALATVNGRVEYVQSRRRRRHRYSGGHTSREPTLSLN